MCSIEVTPLHCIGRQHVLHEAPGALVFVALDNISYIKHLEHGYLPRKLNLYRSSVIGAHCAFLCALGDRTLPTHTTKFGVWLWYHLYGLGAPSQKTSLLGGVAQILINPRPSPCLTDVGLFAWPKSPTVRNAIVRSYLRVRSYPIQLGGFLWLCVVFITIFWLKI